jgi:ATP-dependent helicase/nuclease subunit B
MSLIEAANEREEASALAAAMRQRARTAVLAFAEPTAALVTPDRNLARRVVTELARYGIEANDSGGSPLMSSLQGGLVRLPSRWPLRPGDAVAIAALIKHPLARFGLDQQSAQAAGRHCRTHRLQGRKRRGGC